MIKKQCGIVNDKSCYRIEYKKVINFFEYCRIQFSDLYENLYKEKWKQIVVILK